MTSGRSAGPVAACFGVGSDPYVGKQPRKVGLGIVREGCDEIADVGEGLNLVRFGAGQDAVEHGGRAATLITAKEEVIFSTDGTRADHSLGHIIIDGQD